LLSKSETAWKQFLLHVRQMIFDFWPVFTFLTSAQIVLSSCIFVSTSFLSYCNLSSWTSPPIYKMQRNVKTMCFLLPFFSRIHFFQSTLCLNKLFRTWAMRRQKRIIFFSKRKKNELEEWKRKKKK
jgi:hypothetical protein